MAETTLVFFTQAMGSLRAAYPRYVPSPQQWEATVGAYHRYLAHVTHEGWQKLLGRVPRKFGDFPTVQELTREADLVMREMSGARLSESELKCLPAPEPTRLSPDNPYETAAREWEQSSGGLELDDEDATPRSVLAQRMAKLQKLLDENPIGGDL